MFNLLRFFSIASLGSIVIASIGLSILYREIALRDLAHAGERHIEVLTQIVTNTIWPEFATFFASSQSLSADQITNHPETARLHERLRRVRSGTTILKIKIFTLDGRTAYSSEAKQIGEDKSRNAGFLAAREGEPATEITHRNQFSAFEQTIFDRGVLSTYIPIRRGGSDQIEGVFEVYDDITPLLANVQRSQSKLLVGVLGVCTLLYGVLFFIARHANGIIRRQSAEHAASEARLHEQLERARASDTRALLLASMVEQTPDAILSRDMDGAIVTWNAAAAQLFGYSAEEAIGQPIGALYQAGLPEEELAAILKRIRSGHRFDIEVKRTTRSGGEIDIWITNSPLRDVMGQVVGAMSVMRDVSLRKQQEREAMEAREAAEAANRAKSEFLANMSHEIRTPMNGVLGMMELVLGTDLTAEQREYLMLAATSGKALIGVINDVLDFSKIEAGRLDIDAIEYSPRGCIADVVGMLGLTASQKGLSMDWQVADNVPNAVVGDPGRVRQILVNLIGNAIKFTSHGGITIFLSASPQSHTTTQLSIAVQDTGIGIPKDKQTTIFDPFTQADTGIARRYGGTGLGLSLSARLAALMGGTVAVASEPGKGSTFTVSLPCAIAAAGKETAPAPDPQASVTNAAPPALRSGGASLILLVEDNTVNQRVASRMLEKMGHRVVVAADGVEAVTAFANTRFDLVLMDMQMPVMDGVEATEFIRAREEGTRTPIIALTANVLPSDRKRCLAAGMDDYLAKPFDFEKLRAMLERWLQARGHQRKETAMVA
jgi:PAS domain S-box-containing protein